MRCFLILLAALAILAATTPPATAGRLMRPPKLEKMIKSPRHQKSPSPGASYNGTQESGGHKLLGLGR
jgi:hypothetical protein